MASKLPVSSNTTTFLPISARPPKPKTSHAVQTCLRCEPGMGAAGNKVWGSCLSAIPPVAKTTSSAPKAATTSGSTNELRRISTPRRLSSSSCQRVSEAKSARSRTVAAIAICPPKSLRISCSCTSCPRTAARRATSMPAAPPPTTRTFFFTSDGFGSIPCVRSLPALVFTTQVKLPDRIDPTHP